MSTIMGHELTETEEITRQKADDILNQHKIVGICRACGTYVQRIDAIINEQGLFHVRYCSTH